MGPPEEVIKEYLDVDIRDGQVNDDEIGAAEVRVALQTIESAEAGGGNAKKMMSMARLKRSSLSTPRRGGR